MTGPRFAIGQNVRMVSKFPRGKIDHYVITQALPYDGNAYEYRIKSDKEQFYRVAKEYELDEGSSANAAHDKDG